MLSVNYSLNCTTFDPKGKILQVQFSFILNAFYQIEYAKEAVKQGSTSLGLKSDRFVVSRGSLNQN
jgi:20S proteasome alpha/beta subunit